ncbi:mucin-5AC [Xyrauchen texanus]|uniref:mucin-5AC n=1 Tax=Xyrauchen texanus TaxID=154827 RepID=UPI0022423359|nr:mucin-5AC [Xyrauchen texanus]
MNVLPLSVLQIVPLSQQSPQVIFSTLVSNTTDVNTSTSNNVTKPISATTTTEQTRVSNIPTSKTTTETLTTPRATSYSTEYLSTAAQEPTTGMNSAGNTKSINPKTTSEDISTTFETHSVTSEPFKTTHVDKDNTTPILNNNTQGNLEQTSVNNIPTSDATPGTLAKPISTGYSTTQLSTNGSSTNKGVTEPTPYSESTATTDPLGNEPFITISTLATTDSSSTSTDVSSTTTDAANNHNPSSGINSTATTSHLLESANNTRVSNTNNPNSLTVPTDTPYIKTTVMAPTSLPRNASMNEILASISTTDSPTYPTITSSDLLNTGSNTTDVNTSTPNNVTKSISATTTTEQTRVSNIPTSETLTTPRATSYSTAHLSTAAQEPTTGMNSAANTKSINPKTTSEDISTTFETHSVTSEPFKTTHVDKDNTTPILNNNTQANLEQTSVNNIPTSDATPGTLAKPISTGYSTTQLSTNGSSTNKGVTEPTPYSESMATTDPLGNEPFITISTLATTDSSSTSTDVSPTTTDTANNHNPSSGINSTATMTSKTTSSPVANSLQTEEAVSRQADSNPKPMDTSTIFPTTQESQTTYNSPLDSSSMSPSSALTTVRKDSNSVLVSTPSTFGTSTYIQTGLDNVDSKGTTTTDTLANNKVPSTPTGQTNSTSSGNTAGDGNIDMSVKSERGVIVFFLNEPNVPEFKTITFNHPLVQQATIMTTDSSP